MAITNGYASLTTVKAAARITDAVDDTLLEMAVESSSRMIDGYCGRRFYTAGTETRYYRPRDSYVCEVDDLAGTAITVKSSSAVNGTYDITWAPTDYQLEPLNRSTEGLTQPITALRAIDTYLFTYDHTGEASVEVTGVYGYGTAVPKAVEQATILLALRQYKRFDSPLGVAGFGDMGAVMVRKIDPDVQAMLMPYRRTTYGMA